MVFMFYETNIQKYTMMFPETLTTFDRFTVLLFSCKANRKDAIQHEKCKDLDQSVQCIVPVAKQKT